MLREDPQTTFKIELLGGDASDFTRPAAGERHSGQEVAEELILDRREDELPLLGREYTIANQRLRFSKMGHGAFGDVLLLDRPVERPLDGTDRAVLAGRVVVLFPEPRLDVLLFELSDPQFPPLRFEGVEEVL